MSCLWRTVAFASVAFVHSVGAAASLAAQDSTRTPADTLNRTAAQATPDASDSFPVFPPVVPAEVPPGPLPPGTRYVITRDSIVWSGAVTLSDLLGSIPGVYLARGGFLGLPEYVAYAGRGAAALELYWDGLPLEPVGPDSIFADASKIPLTLLNRVDVEILPSMLRVYLVSERHDRVDATRSVVRIMSGDFRTGAYAGLFQKRWRQGLGISVAGDFVGTDGASGPSRHDQIFDAWVKLEWTPNPWSGATYQIRRQSQDRSAVTPAAGLGIPFREGTRTDMLFRLFAGSRAHGMGLSADAGFGISTWTRDTTVDDQRVRQAFAGVRYARPTWTADVRGSAADARSQLTGEARLAWMPIKGFAISGDARFRRHDAMRNSRRAHGVASIGLGPLALVGEASWQDEVQAPVLPTDTAQRTVDRGGYARFTTRPLRGSVGIVRRDAYLPLPFPDFRDLPATVPSTAATYLVATAGFQPVRSVTIDGWYANPIRGSAALQPPTHARGQFTFRSKFWRTFRSGAFDLKVRLAMESWSRGVAGVGVGGQPVELRGISFYEAYLQFQLVGFTAFYQLRNAYNAREQYVPGLFYPTNAQTFGVRWEFFN